MPKQLIFGCLGISIVKLQITNFKSQVNLQVLILILILTIMVIVVFFAYINAQSVAKDEKRIADVQQIQAALKMYLDENGFYPVNSNGIPKDIETYLSFWPQAPTPSGNCSADDNTYKYVQRPGMDYWVSFCLGKQYQNLSAGPHKASSKGIE